MKLKEKRANQGVTSINTMPVGLKNQPPAFEHTIKKLQAKAKGKVKAKSLLVAGHHVASPPAAGPSVTSHSVPGPSVASSFITTPSVATRSISSPSVFRFSVLSPSDTGHFAVGCPSTTGPSVVSQPITIPSASHLPIGSSFHFPQPIPQSLPTPYMMPTHIYFLPMPPLAHGAVYDPSNRPFVWNVHFTLLLSVPQFSQPGPAYHLLASAPLPHLNPLHGTTGSSLVNLFQVPYSPPTVHGQYSTLAASSAWIGMGPH